MPKRVLVFNSDTSLLSLYREILTVEGGYEVAVFHFNRDNIANILAFQPDLILLDYQADREWPTQRVLEFVRGQETTRHIPVIVATGAVRFPQDLDGKLDVSYTRVLPKPFGVDELLSAVQAALEASGSAADIPATTGTP